MPEIDERERARPQFVDAVVARAPVVEHGRIERRLVHLVFDEQPPRLGQRRVNRLAGCRGIDRAPCENAPGRESCRHRRSRRCAPGRQAAGQSTGIRGCARRPAVARPRRCASGCRTCTSASGPADPERCSSSSSRRTARATTANDRSSAAFAGLSQGICSEMPGVTRVALNTTSQSSSFSKMFRGSPPPGNRAKRVPPVPTPHDGTATRNIVAASTSRSISIPRRVELQREVVEILGQRRHPAGVVLLDEMVREHEAHRGSPVTLPRRPTRRGRSRSGRSDRRSRP